MAKIIVRMDLIGCLAFGQMLETERESLKQSNRELSSNQPSQIRQKLLLCQSKVNRLFI